MMTPQRRNYIIQRLDSFVSDGGATYNTKLFTIEHVLPQHPAEDSDWMKLWPDAQERSYWLNRIANLVPLTRPSNSAAQNYEFDVKKVKYFQSKGGTSSYTLTTQVLNVASWTPDAVKTRQENLEGIFSEKWELRISSGNLKEDPNYKLAGRGGNAEGHSLQEDGFLVLAGSKIAESVTDGFQSGYADLRKQLMSDGTIVNYVFTKDHKFDSVSAAAAVILGRSANGHKEWTKIDGRSYGQVGH